MYGPDATYDAIKSEWKKVARLGDDLWRRRHGHQPQVRTVQPTISRRRQRHPRESIKPETHDIIDLDTNQAFFVTSYARTQADKGPISGPAPRKRKLESEPVSPELEPDGRGQNKRARLDSALNAKGDRNGNTRPLAAVARHTFSTYSDDLFEQIRRAISKTPVTKPSTDSQAATSSHDVVLVPSTVEPMANMEANRVDLGYNLLSGRQERNLCQVSSAEHNGHAWESLPEPTESLHPEVEPGKSQLQTLAASPEAGPSRIRPVQYAEVYQDESELAEVISLSDSDEDRRLDVGAEEESHDVANNRFDKGKARMVEPPTSLSEQVQLHTVPSRVSYLNTELGICYLCSVGFRTMKELRIHERGRWHSHELANDRSVEKAQNRLEKNGLFQRFCSETEQSFTEVPTAGLLKDTQHHARTIIRGPDRAADVDENGTDLSNVRNIVEVSKTNLSAYRELGKSIPRPVSLVGA